MEILLTTNATDAFPPDKRDELVELARRAMAAGFRACIRGYNSVEPSQNSE